LFYSTAEVDFYCTKPDSASPGIDRYILACVLFSFYNIVDDL